MVDCLYLLSLKTIVGNIDGNIVEKKGKINTLGIDNNSKENIKYHLEKDLLSDFINCDEDMKGIVVECYTCSSNNLELMKIFLKYYPDYVDVHNTSYFGETPLHNACLLQKYEVANLLLEYDADPNAQDFENNETPLMCSSFHNYIDITYLLLEYDADTNIINKYGDTALHMACRNENVEIVKLLLQYGANPNIENKFQGSNTPLQIAIKKNNVEIEIILENYVIEWFKKNKC